MRGTEKSVFYVAMHTEGLRRACEEVGGQKQLADRIGTTQSQVWYWLERSKRGVPAEFVAKIEDATEGRITRHDLRPDLFPAHVEAAQ